MKHPVSVKIFGESSSFGEPETGKGIHFITNGYTFSAQAGWGNYCSADPNRGGDRLTPNTIRDDCEIAIWENTDGSLIQISEHDSVRGWVPWGNILDMVEWLRSQPDTPTKEDVIKQIRLLDVEGE